MKKSYSPAVYIKRKTAYGNKMETLLDCEKTAVNIRAWLGRKRIPKPFIIDENNKRIKYGYELNVRIVDRYYNIIKNDRTYRVYFGNNDYGGKNFVQSNVKGVMDMEKLAKKYLEYVTKHNEEVIEGHKKYEESKREDEIVEKLNKQLKGTKFYLSYLWGSYIIKKNEEDGFTLNELPEIVSQLLTVK